VRAAFGFEEQKQEEVQVESDQSFNSRVPPPDSMPKSQQNTGFLPDIN